MSKPQSTRRAKKSRAEIDELARKKLENVSLTITEVYGDLKKDGVLDTYAEGRVVSEATFRRWAAYIMMKHRLYRIPKTIHIAQLLLKDWDIGEIAKYTRVQESTVYAVFCKSKTKFNAARKLAI